jgi:tetratricopeptide (TPR) repeat protein
MNVGESIQRGFAHYQAGRLAEAERLFRAALAAKPSHLDAEHLLGLALCAKGDAGEGLRFLRQTVGRAPGRADFRSNLADALAAAGDTETALREYRAAIRLDPALVSARVNLGLLLRRLGRPDEACKVIEAGLARNPDATLLHHNLAVMLGESGRDEDAITHFRRVAELDPGIFEARLGLGEALVKAGNMAAALPVFEAALRLRPDSAATHAQIGYIHYSLGNMEAAEQAVSAALALDPDAPWPLHLKSRFHLTRGELAIGWALMEHRFASGIRGRNTSRREFAVPRWQGEDMKGKTILVWREEGPGDEIMFASCIPDVAAKAARCVVESSPRLAVLFSRSFPDCDVRPENSTAVSPGDIDYHCPIGSLPGFFRRTVADFPSTSAYLKPDPAKVAGWRRRLNDLGPGLKVGLVWRSTLTTAHRQRWYADINDMAPIFAVPGLALVSLQYGEVRVEIAEASAKHGATIHEFSDLDLVNDIDGTTAMIAALDVVVGPSTLNTALAGGLGKPTYVFVREHPWDWLGQADNPFFPSFRTFFRVAADPDWARAIGGIAEAIRNIDRN